MVFVQDASSPPAASVLPALPPSPPLPQAASRLIARSAGTATRPLVRRVVRMRILLDPSVPVGGCADGLLRRRPGRWSPTVSNVVVQR
ncbi:hypothetical protein Cma02nite_33260 [Cellulomonas marina]|nr:hypothetical protein Cma02nite_33260 [Cellulomonas marina]